MNLWIRSQDGKLLVRPASIYINNLDTDELYAAVGEEDELLIGRYPDESTAMKALDEVVRRMEHSYIITGDSTHIVPAAAQIIDLREVEKAALGTEVVQE